MIFNKTNSIWSLLKVPFKYSPLLSAITAVQKLIDALIPSISVLTTAYFINAATAIFMGNRSYSYIYMPLLFIVLLLAFQLLFDTIIGYATKKMHIRLNNKIAIECIEKQASIAFEYMDNSESYMLIKKIFGEVPSQINTIYNDALSVASLIVRFARIMIIFVSNGMWWIGTLILLSSIPMINVTYKSGKKIYKFYKENFPGQMEMYHSAYILKDRSVTNERTLFGFSTAINSKWKKMQLELYDKKRVVNKKIIFNRYLSRFINMLLAMIIIAFMTSAILTNKMDVGLYIALIPYIFALIDQVISSIMSWTNNLAQEKEFIKDLNVVCNYKYDPSLLCTPNENSFSVETIEFKNVSFVYPGTERKVLNNISFKISKDIHYAFVGKNGAGKSTIIKLLTGLYDDYEGTILVNNKNLKDYSHAEIKSMFGIIYQDYAKYELTLKDSVRIGNIHSILHDVIDDEYIQKLSDVGLIELFEKLPKGGDTLLGKTEEDGQDISGGEWQRVAIARLLMKQVNFMILDEPAASLDPIAESKLYEQFSSISKDKTTLLISHRLGSLKTVDYIFVIDSGEIIESGTHAELIKQAGLYETMYSEQKEWYK